MSTVITYVVVFLLGLIVSTIDMYILKIQSPAPCLKILFSGIEWEREVERDNDKRGIGRLGALRT